MGKMTMYEINGALRDVLDIMTEEMEVNGSISDETMKMYEELSEAKDAKLESIALYFKESQAEADAVKAEAKKLKERADSAQKRADNLKNYLVTIMSADNIDKFQTPRVKVSFTTSKSVICATNWEEVMDKRFVTVHTEVKPNKTEIKKAIEAGEEVKGAMLVEHDNIQIK